MHIREGPQLVELTMVASYNHSWGPSTMVVTYSVGSSTEYVGGCDKPLPSHLVWCFSHDGFLKIALHDFAQEILFQAKSTISELFLHFSCIWESKFRIAICMDHESGLRLFVRQIFLMQSESLEERIWFCKGATVRLVHSKFWLYI